MQAHWRRRITGRLLWLPFLALTCVPVAWLLVRSLFPGGHFDAGPYLRLFAATDLQRALEQRAARPAGRARRPRRSACRTAS